MTQVWSHRIAYAAAWNVGLLALAGDAAGGGARVELVATGEVAGDATDKSGLTGMDPSGLAENLLGSFGSGLDLDPADGTYVAICDRGPFDGASAFRCRVQRFAIRLDEGAKRLEIDHVGTTMLTTAGGEAFVGSLSAIVPDAAGPGAAGGKIARRLDPESIRVSPGGLAEKGLWWVSDEYGPHLDLFGPDGKHVRRLGLPARYAIATPAEHYEAEMPPFNNSGRQANRGLESLAVSGDGSVLYAMTQSPLLQDGAMEGSRRAGLNIRLMELRAGAGASEGASGGAESPVRVREFLYQLDDKRNGVNELLVWDEGTLLVLERDGAKGARATTRRVYAVDLANLHAGEGASDISKIDALPQSTTPKGVRAVAKELFVDLLDPALGLAGEGMPEKIEGLAIGPVLKDGRRTLLVATDNDLLPGQATVVWLLAIGGAKGEVTQERLGRE
jgi:hypothetical protein